MGTEILQITSTDETTLLKKFDGKNKDDIINKYVNVYGAYKNIIFRNVFTTDMYNRIYTNSGMIPYNNNNIILCEYRNYSIRMLHNFLYYNFPQLTNGLDIIVARKEIKRIINTMSELFIYINKVVEEPPSEQIPKRRRFAGESAAAGFGKKYLKYKIKYLKLKKLLNLY